MIIQNLLPIWQLLYSSTLFFSSFFYSTIMCSMTMAYLTYAAETLLIQLSRRLLHSYDLTGVKVVQ